ncbi:MAG: methyltransferase domain-containing protein [Acidobacteria bacterium]|nr:methyltransferase domain-containing protein [Acidobacteriota bacterium]
MEKTERELAFLRDLYITDDYTRRFTELADKHLKLKAVENVLYLNAGTGTHCFAVREAAGDEAAVFAVCENDELLKIAKDKAVALSSDVEVSQMQYDDDAFDVVIADGSLTDPVEAGELIAEAARVARPGGKVMVMLPAAGSFGEIFSLLWEVMLDEEFAADAVATEDLIAELPSTSALDGFAEAAGLAKVSLNTENEIFEYEDGTAFAASPLVLDFLMPRWLGEMSAEKKEQVMERLAQLIDAEDGDLAFRFTVKATVLTGEKAYTH